MARRGRPRTAFACFVHDQLPQLPEGCVADAVPYCSQAWEVRAEWRRGLSWRAGWLAGGSAPFQMAALGGLRWMWRPPLSSGSCARGWGVGIQAVSRLWFALIRRSFTLLGVRNPRLTVLGEKKKSGRELFESVLAAVDNVL